MYTVSCIHMYVYIAVYVTQYLHVHVMCIFFILLVLQITSSNVLVFENNGAAVVQIERSGPLHSPILIQVATVDGTAIGIMC